VKARVRLRLATLSVLATTLAAGVGCTSGGQKEAAPGRVAPLPAGVTGLGPAVFVIRTEGGQRPDLRGLTPVRHFGDDLAGVAPVRRHVQVALGDPTLPTVADGQGEEPRDAILVGGRVIDATLPRNVNVDRVFALAPRVSATGTSCLTVRSDGRFAQPAVEASCSPGPAGGAVWQKDETSYGGINLTTGKPTRAVRLPARPVSASRDGRYLATVDRGGTDRLVIADTATGRVTVTPQRPVPTPSGRDDETGVFTTSGYATVLRPGPSRALSLVGSDGQARTLLSPVGVVAFAPDGHYALVVDTGATPSRLAVVDLRSGAVRAVAGTAPLTGTVAATVAGHHALVTEIAPGRGPADTAARPTRIWAVDLAAARQRAISAAPNASEAEIDEPTTPGLASMRLSPGGTVIAISADGSVTRAPAFALPRLALPGGRALFQLADPGDSASTRPYRLLAADGRGGQVEIRTGADKDQQVDEIIPTPDGNHLIVSLRPTGAAVPRPGPDDEILLLRLDGTGEPTLLYRGVLLASLAVTRG
jgi:hypothetical protein